MGTVVDLGGQRLGSGGGNKIAMHGYERSNFNLNQGFKTTISPGTLVPFLTEIGLPGDSISIDLNSVIYTLPTIGPLYDSYKVQLDVFQVPIRLYNKKLKMNRVGLGMEMDKVYLPQLRLKGYGPDAFDGGQVNPSSILSYLNINGCGRGEDEVYRDFNAVEYLAYFDIFKQYYANKQEEDAYIIHNPRTENDPISLICEINDGNSTLGYITGTSTTTNLTIVGDTDLLMFRFTWSLGMLDPQSISVVIWNWYTNSPITIQLSDYFDQITEGVNEIRFEQPKANFFVFLNGQDIRLFNYEIATVTTDDIDYPILTPFKLENIDKMREMIMEASGNTPFIIDDTTIAPYGLPLKVGDFGYSILSKQEGLLVKTYQSDLFNNWINTETIDGDNGVNAVASVDTSGGSFTIDTLNLTAKVYTMLSRIGASGGTYDDYIDVVYDHRGFKNVENPIYLGGLSKELVFEEVISQSATDTQPLGTLAGRGRMTDKHKGGSIEAKIDEYSIIIGIVSLTPRVCYSQGNKWSTNLKSLADFHKPQLTGIGFQDLITDQMAYWDTYINDSGQIQFNSAGKVPAWINYQTNIDVAKGNFAIEDDSMWMSLNRNYEQENGRIKDLTTYIDPSKYNTIFADTRLDAMNFWVLINSKIFARRKMSEKQIPNL